MADEWAEQVAGIGALAEPARRELYRYVAAQPDAVSREQAAQGVGMALHSAKFHLDKLVDEGLLQVEFRRLSGRRGPGAGRPSKLYRRAEREIAVTLPERRYVLAGKVIAAGTSARASPRRRAPSCAVRRRCWPSTATSRASPTRRSASPTAPSTSW